MTLTTFNGSTALSNASVQFYSVMTRRARDPTWSGSASIPRVRTSATELWSPKARAHDWLQTNELPAGAEDQVASVSESSAEEVRGDRLSIRFWSPRRRIRITGYTEYQFYSGSGYRAASIHVLGQVSRLTPVALPQSETVDLAIGTTLTTFGWAKSSSEYLLTKRNVDIVSSTECLNRNTWFSRCLCTVAWLANDACEITIGSPVVTQENGRDVLLGLRYTIQDACGISGFPNAFTGFYGVLD